MMFSLVLWVPGGPESCDLGVGANHVGAPHRAGHKHGLHLPRGPHSQPQVRAALQELCEGLQPRHGEI